jgi:hypothetical protein
MPTMESEPGDFRPFARGAETPNGSSWGENRQVEPFILGIRMTLGFSYDFVIIVTTRLNADFVIIALEENHE